MKVPFHLRKSAETGPVAGLLLLSGDVGELLALCAAIGGEALPPVFAVKGGFLVVLPQPTEHAFPCALRLRALAPNLFLPVDADLVPALLDDERSALVRERGLVFLPGGQVLGFAPNQPLAPADLIAVPRLPPQDWRPLPPRPDRPDRLYEILLDRPNEGPEIILEAGAGDIGSEAPRPPDTGAVDQARGRSLAGMGRGLMWLGNALRWRGLARLGANLIDRAVRQVPRLTEALLGKQEAALRELLRQFREGKLEDALRRALPLGGTGGRGGAVAGDANLPTHNLAYNLGQLLGGGGPASWWLGSSDVHAQLEAEYRRAAESATRQGDYRRAAFISGKLLHDYRLAADVLARGGLHHDAAVIYLNKLGDVPAAARAFEAAGEIDRALRLYRETGDHVSAGDLLRRAGDEELALSEYRVAAERLAATHDHLAAGELFLHRANRPDLAEGYFAAGWAERPAGSALACLLQLPPLLAHHAEPADLYRLIEEAEGFFDRAGHDSQAGQFYNVLAKLADRPHLAGQRDELRDRALVGLAVKLRQRAAAGGRTAASSLLGQSGLWAPSLVRDAEVAVRGPAPVRGPMECVRLSTQKEPVTAVCAAPQTGDVFLGFASGIVICYRARTGAQISLPTQHWPILALATDATGREVLILGGDGQDTGHLASYRADGEGGFRAGPWRPIRLHGPPHLTPLVGGNEMRGGLWDGRTFSTLRSPDFLPIEQMELPFPADHFGAALLLGGSMQRLVLLTATGVYWLSPVEAAAGASPWAHVQVGWATALPGCSLEAPVGAWLWSPPQSIELAGIDQAGTLWWARLSGVLGPDTIELAHCDLGGDCYLAAALLRPGEVAGVTRCGVNWAQRGERGLRVRTTTRAELADAVACFFSPLTGELLVLCAEGDVVRVPVPG